MEKRDFFVSMWGSVKGWQANSVHTDAGFCLLMPDFPQQLKTNAAVNTSSNPRPQKVCRLFYMQWIQISLFLAMHCSPGLQLSGCAIVSSKSKLGDGANWQPWDGVSSKPQCPTWQPSFSSSFSYLLVLLNDHRLIAKWGPFPIIFRFAKKQIRDCIYKAID